MISRNDWTKARDNAGIAKGAVRGVSMGDALDKLNNALRSAGDDEQKVEDAIRAFKTVYDRYKARIKKDKNASKLAGVFEIIDQELVKESEKAKVAHLNELAKTKAAEIKQEISRGLQAWKDREMVVWSNVRKNVAKHLTDLIQARGQIKSATLLESVIQWAQEAKQELTNPKMTPEEEKKLEKLRKELTELCKKR